MSQAQPNLPQSVFISILTNEYEVKLPNTGEELDIAILMQSITRDKYDSFKLSYSPLLQREALKVETIAYFNTLIPKLKEDLNVKSLYILKHDQMDVLIDAYLTQFLPWFEEWQAFFNKPKTEDKEDAKPAV